MVDPILPESTARLLSDKLYSKRKQAALEIELLVRQLMQQSRTDDVHTLVSEVTMAFLHSYAVLRRKGGLIAAAAIAIGVGDQASEYLDGLVPPVLAFFTDPDPRLRFYACETLYNMIKSSRNLIRPHLKEVFTTILHACGDDDDSVRSGAVLVDRLVKDVVVEGRSVPTDVIFPVLVESVRSPSEQLRLYAIGWISHFLSIPDVDAIMYLPLVLEGLFETLSSEQGEVCAASEVALRGYYEEVERRDELACGRVLPVLQRMLRYAPQRSTRQCERAAQWVLLLLRKFPASCVAHVPSLVEAALASLSSPISEDASALVVKVNAALLSVARAHSPTESQDDELVRVTTSALSEGCRSTRLAGFAWLTLVREQRPLCMGKHAPAVLRSLVDCVRDTSSDVAEQALATASPFAMTTGSLGLLIDSTIELLSRNRELVHGRGNLVVQTLASTAGAENVFRQFAASLYRYKDHSFAAKLIHVLQWNLVAGRGASSLARALRDEAQHAQLSEHDCLFRTLYSAWVANPASLLSLCFLSEHYRLASQLVVHFADLHVTADTLAELDVLVHMLETPQMTHVRVRLLEPRENIDLVRALFGIMAILPQTNAFFLLKERLQPVHVLGHLDIPRVRREARGKQVQPGSIDHVHEELVSEFVQTHAPQRYAR